jgi:hypothetical protein
MRALPLWFYLFIIVFLRALSKNIVTLGAQGFNVNLGNDLIRTTTWHFLWYMRPNPIGLFQNSTPGGQHTILRCLSHNSVVTPLSCMVLITLNTFSFFLPVVEGMVVASCIYHFMLTFVLPVVTPVLQHLLNQFHIWSSPLKWLGQFLLPV